MSTQAAWTSPTGQEFTGTAEYIVGVKAGWDATDTPEAHGVRNIALSTAWQQGWDACRRESILPPAQALTADELAAIPFEPEKAFLRTTRHHELGHPDDVANHSDGGTW